jgi:MEMO1 family protein
MLIRKPAVAGMFYPRETNHCAAALEDCVERARVSACPDVSGRIVGGVVPHAGWMCSGAVAARVIDRIAVRRAPAVVVVFGAIHVRLNGPHAYLYPSGAWESPLGPARVDEGAANQLVAQTDLLAADAGAHAREHSIEVEVPFIQHLLPDSLILPIMVPVNGKAAALGAAVGRVCKQSGIDAIFLASTDLTHYGPSYSFAPQGDGPDGLRWAKDVNDRRMIDLMLAMREDEAVHEACTHWNACGAGAVAATIAACKAMGAKGATLLEHTTSYEVLRERYHEPPTDAVGYAGLVFHE